MNEKEMEEMVKEALRLAEQDKQALLEDFPEIEAAMHEAAGHILPVAVDYKLEDVIYKSLLTGATLVAKKYKEAQRVERELMDSCKSNIKN